ncbi:MAG: adenosylcobinamide-phosphate synthase CbiB [Pseudomonadota bacterium]
MDALGIGFAPGLMLSAWVIEAAFGWPAWIYARIRHPVVWIGYLISACERLSNRKNWPTPARYGAGVFSTLMVIAVTMSAAMLLSAYLPNNAIGFAITAAIASSFLASRSLYVHVAAVAHPLANDDLDAARTAVTHIVGRDPAALDAAGVARAGLESLAENASDGVVAPLFWGVLFGLPGLAAYKAINTLDSMIGHRNEQFAAFGGFAARLDDLVNFVPARLTGLLIALASLSASPYTIMLRDADRHRSPNAGWPEAAMAGALGVRLSGPRSYGARITRESWLNKGAPDPNAADMANGLKTYVKAMMLVASLLFTLTLWLVI